MQHSNPVFLKVTLQLVASFQDDRQLQLHVVGKCVPDHQQMSRSRYVRQALMPELPAFLSN